MFKLLAMPMILKSSDHMVAVTQETKVFMEQTYGIPSEKIVIIPLGVDTRQFRRDQMARKCLRSKFNIKTSDVVLIYVGKVIPTKGIHILIEAALRLMNDFFNVKIVIVGGALETYEAFLKQKIKASKFSHNFVFVPTVPNDELHRYYSIADVGVWPLQCSITMKEAMSCGLPIIISDDSGVSEIVSNCNGYTYQNGDVDRLVAKMKLLMDTTLRKQMSIKAREFAESNDWKFIADRFLELADKNSK